MKKLTENQENKNITTEPKAIICLKLFEFENEKEDNIELDITLKGSIEELNVMTHTLIDNSDKLEIKRCMMILEAIVQTYKDNKQ